VGEDRGIELAEKFAEIGRELLATQGVEETVGLIVHLACATVPGCDHAAVSLVLGDEIHTPVLSDEIPALIDRIQYETGEGPCVDAIRTHQVYLTDDLALETRWPHFAVRASQETGVHSMVAFRLFADGDTMGALNLSSESVGAFGPEAEALGLVFAAHAAIALSSAREEEGLATALRSRDVIGQAKGILMERRRILPADAFDVLRTASQRRNTPLREVAFDLVSTGQDPEACN
jgi:GAF domain-containing protein